MGSESDIYLVALSATEVSQILPKLQEVMQSINLDSLSMVKLETPDNITVESSPGPCGAKRDVLTQSTYAGVNFPWPKLTRSTDVGCQTSEDVASGCQIPPGDQCVNTDPCNTAIASTTVVVEIDNMSAGSSNSGAPSNLCRAIASNNNSGASSNFRSSINDLLRSSQNIQPSTRGNVSVTEGAVSSQEWNGSQSNIAAPPLPTASNVGASAAGRATMAVCRFSPSLLGPRHSWGGTVAPSLGESSFSGSVVQASSAFPANMPSTSGSSASPSTSAGTAYPFEFRASFQEPAAKRKRGRKLKPTGIMCVICSMLTAKSFLIQCHHFYCSSCIKQWLVVNPFCFQCKAPTMLSDIRDIK